MTRRAVPFALVLAVACDGGAGPSPAATVPGAGAATAGAAPRRALVVAVGRYHPDTRIEEDGRPIDPSLDGPANDARLIVDVLGSRFGFGAADVRVLRDEEATVAGVVRAFDDWLVQGVGRETEAVFWFCGHGSRVVDRSRDEVTGDGTLVLYDSRLPQGAPGDLDDDALHALLQACPSERLTVVTDACHSESVTRGSMQARALPGIAPGARLGDAPFWPRGVRILDDDDRQRRPIHWLHVAACGEDEQAFELRMDDGLVHGALTYTLCEQLRVTPPGTPWDAVLGDVRLRLRRDVAQRPWFDGPSERRLFGAAPADGALYCDALVRGEDVVIAAGALHGLLPGAVLDVSWPSRGSGVGAVVLREVALQSARGRWLQPPDPAVPASAALRAVAAAAGGTRRTLPLDAATFASLDDETRAAVAATPWLVTGGGAGGYAFDATPSGPVLRAPDGFRVWPRDGEERDLAELAGEAQREVRFQWLWSLAARRYGELAGDVTCSVGPVLELPPVDADSGTPATLDVTLAFGPARGAACTVVLDLALSTRHVLAIRPRHLGRSSVPEPRREHRLQLGAQDPAHEPMCAPGAHRVLVVSCRDPVDLSMLLDDGTRRRGPEGEDDVLRLDPEGFGIAGIELTVTRPER